MWPYHSVKKTQTQWEHKTVCLDYIVVVSFGSVFFDLSSFSTFFWAVLLWLLVVFLILFLRLCILRLDYWFGLIFFRFVLVCLRICFLSLSLVLFDVRLYVCAFVWCDVIWVYEYLFFFVLSWHADTHSLSHSLTRHSSSTSHSKSLTRLLFTYHILQNSYLKLHDNFGNTV